MRIPIAVSIVLLSCAGRAVMAEAEGEQEPSPRPLLEPARFGPGDEAVVFSLEGLRGDDPDGVPLEGLRVSVGGCDEDEFFGCAFLWGAFQHGEDQTVTSAGAEAGFPNLPLGPFRLVPRFRLGFEYRAELPDDGLAGLAGIGLELGVWLGRHVQLVISRDRDFGFPSGTRDVTGVALRWAHVPGPVRLKSAASRGDRAEVRRLIAAGVAMDKPGSHEALYAASQFCDRPMVETLLEAWKGPADSMSELALRTVVRGCEPDLTELLLRWGQDPNADYYLGSTVLMEAVKTGKHETVRLLLAGGAGIDRRGRYERYITETRCRATALMIAAECGDQGMVDLLLDAGADPSLIDSNGCTAEEAARNAGHAGVADRILARLPVRKEDDPHGGP